MDVINIIAIIISNTLFVSAPLIFTALGGVFSERSGVVNIGLEGLMLFGAFTGVFATLELQGSLGAAAPWVAVVIAAISCGIFAILHAVASVSFRADQVVSGVALNFLATGLSVFLIKKIYGKGQTDFVDFRIDKIDVPVLHDIPVIGKIFFTSVPITSYIAIAFAFVVWFVIYKTPFGLRLRAVGEHPAAADTMGINVTRMRYTGVILSGVMAGIGGSVYALSISGNFMATTISGQGFLSIAAMIFGKWNPIGAMAAALFFGLAQSLSISAATIPGLKEIPNVILMILPYVLTILALTGFVGRSEAPRDLGNPYIKGKR